MLLSAELTCQAQAGRIRYQHTHHIWLSSSNQPQSKRSDCDEKSATVAGGRMAVRAMAG